ncbi:hypothetical protein [uncultured Winogradskyella sp.]|uniref:hypothetical protein n=1 Tax=uncultured Winogradskyella sp. TaxID=395353 RepID=UPI002621DBB1|nr:hypothetical protein [uncultured Winogradskyella sp.]
MNSIIFNKPIPTPKLIYGVGLVAIGIISLLSGNNIGYMSIGLSLYFLKKDGLEIDPENKKYREIISLFSFSFGKWQDLPDIEYVSVFKTSQTTRVWVSTASTKVTSTTIKINLFYNTNQKIEAYETQNIEDAFEKAKQIATVLNIDILDATQTESKWL